MPASLKPGRPRAQASPPASLPVPADFAARLVHWQKTQGRHGLPWQGSRDAYRIWLSEIMLQQTQVATVLRYYAPFLQRFPTVAHLAGASLDDVLAAWSGLGYYSRARNLHACAQEVVRQHAGVFPQDAEVLERLPGIGRSTAAAVAVFSAGQHRAILDGNVKRVLCRHRAFGGDLSRGQPLQQLWSLAQSLLPSAEIEAYTQGLMDLGATVCTSRQPACGRCPVGADCCARVEGRMQDYPLKLRRQQRSRRDSVVLLAIARPAHQTQGPRVLIGKRPPRGIWAGLWCLPLLEDGHALERLLEPFGHAVGSAQARPLATIEHALTHLEWTLRPHRIEVLPHQEAQLESAAAGLLVGSSPQSHSPSLQWMPLDTALSCGLPSPMRRLLEDLAAAY